MTGVAKEPIAIKDLNFWHKNPRFFNLDLGDNQNKILNYLVSNENYKVKELAKRISADIDAPALENLVVYFNNDKNIVYEGNRRLAAYKSLENPIIIKELDIRNKIIDMKREIGNNRSISDIKVDCLVTSDEEIALDYVKSKHNNPNDPVYQKSWGDLERAVFRVNYDNGGKDLLLKIKVAERINELGLPEGYANQVLGPGFVTTLFKIIAAKTVDILGITYEDGNVELPNTDEFNITLGNIIVKILEKDEFHDKPLSRLKEVEITEYIEKISSHKDNDKLNKWLMNIKPMNEVLDKVKKRSPRTPPGRLVPADCRIEFTNKRASQIFDELKNKLVLGDNNKNSAPNAVGVLFRVFLELSLKEYGKVFRLGFGQNTKLRDMVRVSVNDMQTRITDEDILEYVKKSVKAPPDESFLSAQTFHEYVHSTDVEITAAYLNGQWNRLERFFNILWDEIGERENINLRK